MKETLSSLFVSCAGKECKRCLSLPQRGNKCDAKKWEMKFKMWRSGPLFYWDDSWGVIPTHSTEDILNRIKGARRLSMETSFA